MRKFFQKKILTLCIVLLILLSGFLRFFQLTEIPPGLYIDEVSIGQNAYLILTSGKDEHGQKYPLWFKAFGEYKLPVYIYTVASSMALFGKDEFAVRFPSAFAGTLTILMVFLLIKQLLDNNTKISKTTQNSSSKIAFVSAFILAINPWHIQFSRGGFEANVALFFLATSIFLFLHSLRGKFFIEFLMSLIFLVLSVYTYQPYRIISPGIYLYFCFYLFQKRKIKQIFLGTIIFFILFIPIISFSLSPVGSARFSQTSAFEEYPAASLQEKVITYPMVFVKNYFSYFSFEFLFIRGDGIGRHQPPYLGLLYHWQVPFLILGIYFLGKQKGGKSFSLLIFLLLISPIPGSLTRPSPHTLRSLSLVLPISIITGLGLYQSFHVFSTKLKQLFLLILFPLIIADFFYFNHLYYFHYPFVNIPDWGGGAKELIADISKYKDKYDAIVIDEKLNIHPVYFSFYDDSIKPLYVTSSWNKDEKLKGKAVLYIRPHYGEKSEKIIHAVFLKSKNKDILAEFWSI